LVRVSNPPKSHQSFLKKQFTRHPDWRAFVASPNKGVGENRSVVLIGNSEVGWSHGGKFWGGDHRERAERFAEELNGAAGKGALTK
jgi:hypothetical protein